MRPAILYSMFSDLKNLRGVGPKRYQAYVRLGCKTALDLLFHYPVTAIDRRNSPPLCEVKNGEVITVLVKVERYIAPKSPKSPYKVYCRDASGGIELVYFNSSLAALESMLPINNEIVISGVAEFGNKGLQMNHPDIVAHKSEYENVRRMEPVYPLTYGLHNRYLSNTIAGILRWAPDMPEWIPQVIIKKYNWPSWRRALMQIHNPSTTDEIISSTSRDRLAFDELLAQQLRLRLVRNSLVKQGKRPLEFSGELCSRFCEVLPFVLTDDQRKSIVDISNDQRSPHRMVRLLQGDVGSGKTVVIISTMLNAVEAGGQAVLMAPTEILARQHHSVISAIAGPLGLTCKLLLGKSSAAQRNATLAEIADGRAQIIIGTHALFQKRVDFHKLLLVSIDEQHRFGVEQRQALVDKGMDADLLLVSATPIPRTLSMVNYGDIDVTSISQKPSSRRPIVTKIISDQRLEEVMDRLVQAVSQNAAKAYWLCPLIEDSENSDLTNVTKRAETLQRLLPLQVGLLHGQMKTEEKAVVMERFQCGEIRVLVATTVIEVGVDVPDSTIIVIENAETFGLSQLHQLRGRVGRGHLPSSCILLHKRGISPSSYQRLGVIASSEDGFYIAQRDLDMRGSGEVLGTKQSGTPDFKNFNFWQQSQLVAPANKLACEIIESDPMLQLSDHENLKLLLALYNYDQTLAALQS